MLQIAPLQRGNALMDTRVYFAQIAHLDMELLAIINAQHAPPI